MKPRPIRDIVLSTVALGCLAIYIIACRASFSPDGKKILFPFLGADGTVVGIALHDREGGATRPVFTTSGGDGPDRILSVRWTPDGERAVVLWPDDDELAVLSLAPDAAGPTRYFEVPGGGDEALQSLIVPPPIAENRLFVGGDTVRRLDLETGEVEIASGDAPAEEGASKIALLGGGSAVVYVSKHGGDLAVGTVDPETLALRPASLPDGLGTIEDFLAASDDGERLAFVASGTEGPRLVVVRRGEVERELRLEAVDRVGPGEFSPEGKTLYLPWGKKHGDRIRLGVLEVPVDGGEMRTIPLLAFSQGDGGQDLDEALMLLFQVSVDPAGKTLAANGGYLDPEKVPEAARALYLVDLTSPERTVEKVALPVLAPWGDPEK